MRKVAKFAEALGFSGVEIVPTVNKGVIGFRYAGFDVGALWSILGRYKKHSPDGRFIYIVEKASKIMRVDTNKRIVLLGDGEWAYNAIYKSL
jgi:hypothetical protein